MELLDEIRTRYVDHGESSYTIAGALGIAPTTVRERLKAAGVELRPRGRQRGAKLSDETRRKQSKSGAAYWASGVGQEDPRRPIKRVCEGCGGHAKRGRLCADCASDERRARACAPESLARLRAGRADWRRRADELSAAMRAGGYIPLGEVSAALPRQYRRTYAALHNHVQDGGLPATRDELDRLWVAEAELAGYVQWLRDHRNGKLRRFNDLLFRAQWLLNRHKKTDAFGALGGRPSRSDLDDEPAVIEEIRELRARGHSRQHTAAIVSQRFAMTVTPKQVRRYA